MIRRKRERPLWMEGYGDELLSPACLWLRNTSLRGSERHLETTDEKEFFLTQPHGAVNHQSIKLLTMPQLQLIIQAGE